MILSIETTLRSIAAVLHGRIAPAIDDRFAGETVRLAELLLTLNAGWIDDAVAIRVAENSRIRSLFADAEPVVADRQLASRIAEASRTRDPGLKISELDRENNRLRGLLAELHAQVDADQSEAARDFSQSIWRALAGFEAARAPR